MKIAIPYGAFELKRAYQRNFSTALLLAVSVHLLLISSFMFFAQTKGRQTIPVKPPFKLGPQELGPPPTVTKGLTPEVLKGTQGTAVPPSVGIPRAIPDEQTCEERSFASQDDLQRALRNPLIDAEGQNGDGSLDVSIPEEHFPAPEEFVPVQEIPVLINEVKPVYPELARRSGLEGRVWVEVLVDKSGKVRDARCVKGPGSFNLEVFCEPAVQAAMQNEFRPGINNKVPVACWVTYPVNFNLR